MKRVFTHLILLIFFVASNLPAQFTWTKYSGNPVLTHGPAGAWDSLYIQHSAVVFDGNEYHMFYTGSSGITNISSIGHATSNDGITWVKDTLNNPVLEKGISGSWDREWIGISAVFYDNSVFHMWYTGGIETQSLYRIGYATSNDGITWTKYDDPATTSALYAESDPVLMPTAGAWDSRGVEAPMVIREGNSYTMWYNGYTNSFIPGIGRATSTDGINWNKDTANNPVLTPEAGSSWENNFLRLGSVVFDQNNSIYHMFYYGGPFYVNFRTGYAWSTDGINWTKYDNPATPDPPFNLSDPVLQVGPQSSWDDTQVMGSWVIFDADTCKMWYTGADDTYPPETVVSAIGYATLPVDTLIKYYITLGIEKTENSQIPENLSLQQNYPNPFNPSTTIEFSIPKSEFVTLKVYNLLGEEVAILVSDKLTSGNYKYNWNAGSLASGVYLYQLQTGTFTETRKMVLLQ